MQVEKNRKGTKCDICRKKINGKKRVSIGGGLRVMKYYHLNCYFNWLNKNLERWKEARKILVKHRNYMIVEKLQDE